MAQFVKGRFKPKRELLIRFWGKITLWVPFEYETHFAAGNGPCATTPVGILLRLPSTVLPHFRKGRGWRRRSNGRGNNSITGVQIACQKRACLQVYRRVMQACQYVFDAQDCVCGLYLVLCLSHEMPVHFGIPVQWAYLCKRGEVSIAGWLFQQCHSASCGR